MKIQNLLLTATLVALLPILAIYTHFGESTPAIHYEATASPSTYEWKQILPFGNGTQQYEWKTGTYPMGIKPLVAFGGNLWMTGQKAAWSSPDGTTWTRHPKKDWGERITMTSVFFDNTLWMYGGMKYQERQLINEIWYSKDGINWQQAENASWQPRKGHEVVEFNNKLWLFGGVSRVSKDFESLELKNDVWSSTDGLHWIKEVEKAPWSPRDSPQVLVIKGMLYLLSGQGLADVWQSTDGKTWKQLTAQAPWKERFDNGALVFDNQLWVFGGRDTNPDHHVAAQNDVWFSDNGSQWRRQAEHAPWTVRSGGNSVVFKDQLWLYSGKHTGGNPVWRGDAWTLEKMK